MYLMLEKMIIALRALLPFKLCGIFTNGVPPHALSGNFTSN